MFLSPAFAFAPLIFILSPDTTARHSTLALIKSKSKYLHSPLQAIGIRLDTSTRPATMLSVSTRKATALARLASARIRPVTSRKILRFVPCNSFVHEVRSNAFSALRRNPSAVSPATFFTHVARRRAAAKALAVLGVGSVYAIGTSAHFLSSAAAFAIPKAACEAEAEVQAEEYKDTPRVRALSSKDDGTFILYRSQMINTWFEFLCIFIPYCKSYSAKGFRT